jgi:hypothetical protein
MSWNEPLTERQEALIKKLYLEIDPEFGADRARALLAGKPTRREASNRIDTLIEEARRVKAAARDAARAAEPVIAPAPVVATVSTPAVRPALVFPEDGYYAVFYEHVLRFYRVKHGKGYYKERQFLDRFKSDELMNIYTPEKMAVLDLINADPNEAQMRFAVELTRCFCCGRMLTDEISRLRGIGPDCFGRRKDRDEIGMKAISDLASL